MASATAAVISWSLERDRLTKITLGTYATEPGTLGPYDPDPVAVGMDLDGIAVTVGDEDTPSGSRLRVLHVPYGAPGLPEFLAYATDPPPQGTAALMDLHRSP